MHNKKWATINDNRLMEVVLYHETKGMTVPVRSVENLYHRFGEFKRYIMRGSFTLQQLEDNVFGRFGIKPDFNTPAHKFLSNLEKMVQHEREQKKKKKDEKSS